MFRYRNLDGDKRRTNAIEKDNTLEKGKSKNRGSPKKLLLRPSFIWG